MSALVAIATTRRRALLALTLLAGLVAASLSGTSVAFAAPTGHQGRHTTAQHATRKPTTDQQIANSLLNMVNAERRAHALPALTMNSDLIKSAHGHNLRMARTNVMSHQEAGEADLATRITKVGYKWSWAGENIGWNSEMTKSGVLALEQMMYDEKPPNDGHRLNILSTHFKNIGVDVYMDTVHDKVWLTTDFGRH